MALPSFPHVTIIGEQGATPSFWYEQTDSFEDHETSTDPEYEHNWTKEVGHLCVNFGSTPASDAYVYRLKQHHIHREEHITRGTTNNWEDESWTDWRFVPADDIRPPASVNPYVDYCSNYNADGFDIELIDDEWKRSYYVVSDVYEYTEIEVRCVSTQRDLEVIALPTGRYRASTESPCRALTETGEDTCVKQGLRGETLSFGLVASIEDGERSEQYSFVQWEDSDGSVISEDRACTVHREVEYLGKREPPLPLQGPYSYYARFNRYGLTRVKVSVEDDFAKYFTATVNGEQEAEYRSEAEYSDQDVATFSVSFSRNENVNPDIFDLIEFVGWKTRDGSTYSQDESLTIEEIAYWQKDTDIDIVASFRVLSVGRLTVLSENTADGTVTPESQIEETHPYDFSIVVTARATPAEGKMFDFWIAEGRWFDVVSAEWSNIEPFGIYLSQKRTFRFSCPIHNGLCEWKLKGTFRDATGMPSCDGSGTIIFSSSKDKIIYDG